jgi:hypothetical protein
VAPVPALLEVEFEMMTLRFVVTIVCAVERIDAASEVLMSEVTRVTGDTVPVPVPPVPPPLVPPVPPVPPVVLGGV